MFGHGQPQPSNEQKSLSQLKRNWRNRVMNRVMEKTLADFSIKEFNAIKEMVPNVTLDTTVEDLVVEYISRFMAFNGTSVTAMNSLNVIKYLSTNELERVSEQLCLKLVDHDTSNV